MNHKHTFFNRRLLALALAFSLHPLALVPASPLGTAFTYQGRLNDTNGPVTGYYDFFFSLYDSASNETGQIGSSIPYWYTPVTNGLFTVTLDFGNVFTGNATWLKIIVRTNGAATWTTLSPRQPLTPAPYAVMANSASNLLGTLPAAQLSGALPSGQLAGTYSSAVTLNNAVNSFSGSGAGLTGLNASQLSSGTVTDARLSPNVSLLGQSIESGEITDGTIVNADISATAAISDTKLATITTAGKVANSALSSSVSLLGSSIESGEITDGTIAAADVAANTFWGMNGNAGTTPGTHFLGTTDNQALEIKVKGYRVLRLEPGDGYDTPNVIGGRSENLVSAGLEGVTIAGGGRYTEPNSVMSSLGTVGGGCGNRIQQNGWTSTIGGGEYNIIQPECLASTIAGGQENSINQGCYAATISGGRANKIGGGWINIIVADSDCATITGGDHNAIGTNSANSAIGGGYRNAIADNSGAATIAGGQENNIGTNSAHTAIGGGYDNNIAASSDSATIAGGQKNDIGTNSSYSAIGGGTDNNIADNSKYATIAGGISNDIGTNSASSTIGGGTNNNIADNAVFATIAGGQDNYIATNSTYATVSGGQTNLASDDYASVGGGYFNRATNRNATIPGGWNNVAGGDGSIVAGGTDNTVTGDYSLASGRFAQVTHPGSFVWSSSEATASPANYSFTARAHGGVRFYTASGTATGVQLAASGGSWTSLSDRNAKENFQPIDPRTVLDKVVALPVSTWKYKSQDPSVRHIGPVAQDFKAAFDVGESDTGITSVDADGVALAAIQGLNEKVEVGRKKEEGRMQSAEESLRRLATENAELKKRLKRLERLLNAKTGGEQ